MNNGLRNCTSRQVRHVRAAVQLLDYGQLSRVEAENRCAVTYRRIGATHGK